MQDDSAKQVDENNFVTISDNPISRSGIFQYLGSSIGAPEPDKIYNVYRPAEELQDPEAIESFKLIPIVNDHNMLGSEESGLTPPEYKGVHGSTGEEIYFKDGVLLAKLKIYSQSLQDMIKEGKKDLSLGYRCQYFFEPGIFDGQKYDYVQRKLRGNHLALVDEARCAVSVLDQQIAFDHVDLALNIKEFVMADEDKGGEKEESKEMSITEAHAMLKDILPKVAKITELMKKHGGDTDAEEETEEQNEAEDVVDPSVKPFKTAGVTDEDTDKPGKGADKEECDEVEKAKDWAEEKKGMDAAIKSLTKQVDALQKNAVKSVLSEVSQRNTLADRLSHHVGTFDHSDMTLSEVAAYGVKKLGIKAPKGQELIALDGFLHNRSTKSSSVTFSEDSFGKTGSKIDSILKKASA